MVCKHCKKPIKSDFKFCPYCGERTVNDFQDHYGELEPPPVLERQEQEPPAYYAFGSQEVRPEDWPSLGGDMPEDRGAPPLEDPPDEDGELPYYVFRPKELPDPAPGELPEPPSPKIQVPQSRPEVGLGAKCAVAVLSMALGVAIAAVCWWLAFGGTGFRPSDLSALFV